VLSLRLPEMETGFEHGVELRHHLFTRFLNAKIRRPLSKPFVNAGNHAGYTWRIGCGTRRRVSHVYTDDHSLVLVDDTKSRVVNQLIDTTKLKIELESDIRKILG